VNHYGRIQKIKNGAGEAIRTPDPNLGKRQNKAQVIDFKQYLMARKNKQTQNKP